MKKQKYISVLIALATLTACSSDATSEQEGVSQLDISTQIAATRTTLYDGLQENDLSTGTTASIYVYRTGAKAVANSYGHENLPYTYNTTSKAWTHKKLFFPTDRTDVDVFVYAPRTDNPAGVTTIPITVQTDQSTTAGYLASDFVFGNKHVDYTYPLANVSVKLFHAMSKLVLNFKDVYGETNSLGTLQKVELGTETYGIRLNALVDITSSVSTVADLKTNNAVTTLADYGIITMLDTSKESSATPWSVACILPPQTLPEEGTNLTLTFSTGKTYEGILKATLETGCTHTYTVTIDQEKLTFSGVTIQQWGAGWGEGETPSRILY